MILSYSSGTPQIGKADGSSGDSTIVAVTLTTKEGIVADLTYVPSDFKKRISQGTFLATRN